MRSSLPSALPRPTLVLVGLAAVFLVVSGLRDLSGLLGPAFLALVLTIAAHPLQQRLARTRLPRWAATALSITAIYTVLLSLAGTMLIATARFAALLPTYKNDANQVVRQGLTRLESAGVGQQQIDQMAQALDAGKLIDAVAGALGGLLDVLSGLFFVVTLVLFMAADAGGFPQRLLGLPEERSPLLAALTGFARGTRRYLVVSTVFGLIVALIDTAALLWIGVPAAGLWGLLSFITNYVPNIGFVIGVAPPAVIGLLEGGWTMLLAVVATYSVINVVIQTFIQPKVVGDAVGLSSTITMLSLAFWAFTLGAVGALMAVPLTLLVKAMLIDADPQAAWVGRLLSAGPYRP